MEVFYKHKNFKYPKLVAELHADKIDKFEIEKISDVYPNLDVQIRLNGKGILIVLTSQIERSTEQTDNPHTVFIMVRPYTQVVLPVRRNNMCTYGIYADDVIELLHFYDQNGFKTFNYVQKNETIRTIRKLYPRDKKKYDKCRFINEFSTHYINIPKTAPCTRFSITDFCAPPVHEFVNTLVKCRRKTILVPNDLQQYKKTMLAFPPSWILIIFRPWRDRLWILNSPSKDLKAEKAYKFMNCLINALFCEQFSGNYSETLTKTYIEQRNHSWRVLIASKFTIFGSIVIRCMKHYGVTFDRLCDGKRFRVSYKARVKYITSPQKCRKQNEMDVWNALAECRRHFNMETIALIVGHHAYQRVIYKFPGNRPMWYNVNSVIRESLNLLYSFLYGTIIKLSAKNDRVYATLDSIACKDVHLKCIFSMRHTNVKRYANNIFKYEWYVGFFKYLRERDCQNTVYLRVLLDCIFKDKLIVAKWRCIFCNQNKCKQFSTKFEIGDECPDTNWKRKMILE